MLAVVNKCGFSPVVNKAGLWIWGLRVSRVSGNTRPWGWVPAAPSLARRSSLKLLNPQFPGGSHPSLVSGASSAIHGLAFITLGVMLSHTSLATLTALHPAISERLSPLFIHGELVWVYYPAEVEYISRLQRKLLAAGYSQSARSSSVPLIARRCHYSEMLALVQRP